MIENNGRDGLHREKATWVADRERGFSLVEAMMASAFLVFGLMTYGAVVTSYSKLSVQTRDLAMANQEVVSAVEEFRDDLGGDFAHSVDHFRTPVTRSAYLDNVSDMKVTRHVICDETLTSPAVDLNGDGDTDDRNPKTSELRAAYLMTTVKWTGPNGERTMKFPSLFARAEVQPGWTSPVRDVHSELEGDSSDPLIAVDGLAADGLLASVVDPQAAQEASLGLLPLVELTPTLSVLQAAINPRSNELEAAFDLSGAESVPVIAVTIVSGQSAGVAELEVNSRRVFRANSHQPRTGQTFETVPFDLVGGINTIDAIEFVSPTPQSRNGFSFGGGTIHVVFHTESGERIPLTFTTQ